MEKDNLSRRDFLKVTLLGIGAGLLAACKQIIKPAGNISATLTATASKTNTHTPEPTGTETPAPTETATQIPTDVPSFKLLTPANGAELPALGKVIFTWESFPSADKYQIQFTLPNGTTMLFDVDSTSYTRYLESFPMGGTFTWQVTAFDGNNSVICISDPFTFTKAEYQKPNNGSGNDGGAPPTLPPPTIGPDG